MDYAKKYFERRDSTAICRPPVHQHKNDSSCVYASMSGPELGGSERQLDRVGWFSPHSLLCDRYLMDTHGTLCWVLESSIGVRWISEGTHRFCVSPYVMCLFWKLPHSFSPFLYGNNCIWQAIYGRVPDLTMSFRSAHEKKSAHVLHMLMQMVQISGW